jgi:glutathione S-transferase
MLKLHGFAVSNYYNMVKLALLEKEIEFEQVISYPSQEAHYLQRNPVGKVPALETEQGFLSETGVILDYIEQAYPQSKPLMPKSLFAQSQVKELIQMLQLYIELPARRCFGEAFFGGKVEQLTKDETKEELLKGIKALKRRAKFSPYIAGDTFTSADIVFIYSIDLARLVAKKLFKLDLLDGFEEAKQLIEKLKERPHVLSVNAEHENALAAFIESKK